MLTCQNRALLNSQFVYIFEIQCVFRFSIDFESPSTLLDQGLMWKFSYQQSQTHLPCKTLWCLDFVVFGLCGVLTLWCFISELLTPSPHSFCQFSHSLRELPAVIYNFPSTSRHDMVFELPSRYKISNVLIEYNYSRPPDITFVKMHESLGRKKYL